MKKFNWKRLGEWFAEWSLAMFGYAMVALFLIGIVLPIWIKFWQTIENFWGVELFP